MGEVGYEENVNVNNVGDIIINFLGYELFYWIQKFNDSFVVRRRLWSLGVWDIQIYLNLLKCFNYSIRVFLFSK